MHYPFYMPFTIPTIDPDTLYQMQATPASVPWKMACDTSANVGLFVKAILVQPEKTLPGKFVLSAVEDLTAGEAVEAWTAGQGKKGVLLQVDRETYHKLWAPWTEVMDDSHRYWEMMRERSFSGEEGILTKDDLEVTGLVGTAATFAKMQG